MTENGAHPNLAAALCAAQAEFKPLKMNKKANIPTSKGTYSYGYADLSAVIAAVRPALTAHGLAFTQRIMMGDNGLIIHTELIYGQEKLVSEWPFALQTRPQDTGANLTYYRRYALTSLLGIAAEETDDESAQTAGEEHVKKQRQEADFKPHGGAVPMTGPLTKTQLQAGIKALYSDIEATTEPAELTGLLKDHEDIVAQCQKDLPGWWFGDERNKDYHPPAKLIEAKWKEFMEQDTTGIKPDPEDMGAGEQPEPPELTEPML